MAQQAVDAAEHSAAARRVKVKSRIRLGSMPWAISQATRCTSVAVLPVPAPAMISSGRWSWVAAWRCWGFSRAKTASIEGEDFIGFCCGKPR